MTVGLREDGTPGELFLSIKKVGSLERGLFHTVALLVSIALQHGVPLAKICDKLTGIHFEPCGITSNKDIPLCRSIVDYVARWLLLFSQRNQKPKEEGKS
jgi:ribonucleoside-diphosphate reductase alpha chain